MSWASARQTECHWTSRSLRSERQIFSRDFNWEIVSSKTITLIASFLDVNVVAVFGTWPGSVNHTCWPADRGIRGEYREGYARPGPGPFPLSTVRVPVHVCSVFPHI